ncbi:ATP-grasp domain-containing protein [Kitasatospora sp. NPDC085895]|uniref:carboxylate--amine ligase n=1 Tax=Kitasatospora sp. NPDC085895 TaxID=3155057 RepID=UPI00344F5C17
MQAHGPELDREVPVLLVKVGRYPDAYGATGAARSLGRAGVPVYALVEDRLTPTAVSRYVRRAFVRPSTGREPAEVLVAALLTAGRAIGRPTIPVPTDDEAAVLLAEHQEELAPHFLLPPVPAGLPRRLADKGALGELCRRYGVATPRACTPADRAELLATARRWGYPVVLKNLAPFTRLASPAVSHTTVVPDEAALTAACPPDGPLSVLLQEYVPQTAAEDWITHLCCGPGGKPLVVFTGVKDRSWPPETGVTTRGHTRRNPELAAIAGDFCRAIGYCGTADLDWRYDRRTGRYNLVDFNPRNGAQFRLFETVDGVDVVRALHLSLTGRTVPAGPQLPRRFRMGRLDTLSAAASAWTDRRRPWGLWPEPNTEHAWFAADDPAPAAMAVLRFGLPAPYRLLRSALRS